jgi:hypothetical protein
MITQLLGVALISLLTITPTIQQNNIEQLIAPNIEITQNTFNTNKPLQVYVLNQFSIYHNSNNAFNINNLFTNFNSLLVEGFDYTTANFTMEFLYIDDTNLHYTGRVINGNTLRAVARNYYQRMRGSLPTSETFSFTATTTSIPSTTSYYTYTLNGSSGIMSGNIYVKDNNLLNTNSGILTNNNVSIPQGTSLQNLINNNLIPVTNIGNNPLGDHKVLYYWTESPLNNTTIGTYSTRLRSRTSYGRVIDYGQFTYNITAPDTTPPTITSITGNLVNFTNQNVTLTVQASDNVALNSNAYSFDNGVTYQQSNFKIFTTNEIVNIKVRDSSNNETSQQVIINRIDKQSPSINLAGNWRNTFELGELTSNNDLYNYLSISDGASGINSSLTTIFNFNYNQAGTYSNVQVSATDNAGNTFVNTLPTITITQPVDNTPPTISGATSITRQQGNITTQDILNNFTISDPSGISETRIQLLDNTIVTSWNDFTTGTYQLRVYARDTVGNIALYQFELIVTPLPIPDTTPPVITGSLLTSFVIGTYTSTSEILALYTITDNVAVGVSQVIGTIDFEELGDYSVTISATDTSNNTSTLNIVVRIRSEVVLGNYNPLTDLLSGIFGGLLSMIFTIGTINVLGLRLLDAMGVIILGAVLLFVYKAIKGGS